MSPRPMYLLLVAFVTVLGLIFYPPVTGAEEEYQITMPESTDTPPQEFTYDGQTYEISSIGTVDTDEQVTAFIHGSGGIVSLLPSDSTLPVDGPKDLDSEVSFESDGPGTYVLAIDGDETQSTYDHIYPVVVSGYNIETDHEDIIPPNEDIKINIKVIKDALDTDPEGVEVAIWDKEDVIRTEAEDNGDDTYTATISASDIDADTEYDVYAAVLGPDDIEIIGEPEMLALSDKTSITVVEEDEESEDNENGDDDSSGDGDDGTDDDDSGSDNDDGGQEQEQSQEDDAASDDDQTDDQFSDSDETDDGSTDEVNESIDDESNHGEDDTADGVIEPNDVTDNDGTEGVANGADQVPFTGMSLLLGVLFTVAIGIRILRTQ